MVLEAVMICLDNSEPMRNGDYSPTRLAAMIEAVNEIANAKLNGNQETTVGVLSMAGRGVEVHLAPCRNFGAIMTAIQKEVKIGGECNFAGALKTAQLALKNRPNKSQRQRIIMFVGSPVVDDAKELVKLGKLLKKNNVAVDIINFGTENSHGSKTENPEKLDAFIQSVNAQDSKSVDSSHLVHIPPGPLVFSDVVLTSAVLMEGGGAGGAGIGAGPSLGGTPGAGAGGAGAGGGGGGAGGFAGGVDPNLDPELAMALRISMEENRAAQEAAFKGQAEAKKPAAAPAKAATTAPAAGAGAGAGSTAGAGAGSGAAAMDETDDEEALLAKAIAMSMAAGGASGGDADGDAPMTPAKTGAGASKDDQDIADALKDPSFISQLIDSVPGVAQGDLDVDDILNQLTGGGGEEAPKKADDKGKKDDKGGAGAGGAGKS